jgi:hypothetical protein
MTRTPLRWGDARYDTAPDASHGHHRVSATGDRELNTPVRTHLGYS